MTSVLQPTATIDVAVPLWCRDLVSCLQATFATVLGQDGQDPLEVLGAGWEFLYRPGEVTSEEFYYPTRFPGDLGRSLAPHHRLSSAWWQPVIDADPLAELRARLDQGRLTIAAVDNFYLPFRPAFGDVHAAHLLVVTGLDEARGLIHVSDGMPPAFRGPIAIDDFLLSWGSSNPRDVQDAFFSDTRIGRRCLDVTVGGPYPALDPQLLDVMLRANLDRFGAADAEPDSGWGGLAGVTAFLADLLRRSRAGDPGVLPELYPFGWAMQAQASLHGELLRTRGAAWALPRLAEAGRTVESVAHAWSGLRMTAAHGRTDPAAAVPQLARHAALLRRRYEEAVEAVQLAVDEP